MRNPISKIGIMLLLTCLSACDPSRIKEKNKTLPQGEAKYCFFDGGGSFGKAGIRARQNIGNGPKMRVSQWQTAGFNADTKSNHGNSPNLEVLLSWRVSVSGNNTESSFESLEVQINNLSEVDKSRAAKWRILNYDGEAFEFPFGDISKSSEIFSADAKGILIAGLLGESFGGINGGSFELAIIDGQGLEIVSRKFTPPKSWEFKKSARIANQGLEDLLKTPEKCTALN